MSKYHNKKTVVKGITFDSIKEGKRFEELLLLRKAGKIKDLKLQPEFVLCNAWTDPDEPDPKKRRQKAVKYIADFSYLNKESDAKGNTEWQMIVEDVKGIQTDTYKLKKRLMREKYGIKIKET